MEFPYISEWRGNEKPSVQRGKACFAVGEKRYEFTLPSFEVFLLVGEMLRKAYKLGAEQKAKEIQDRLRDAINL